MKGDAVEIDLALGEREHFDSMGCGELRHR